MSVKAVVTGTAALAVGLLVAGIACDGLAATGAAEPSLFTRLVAWIYEQQRAFHRELTQALRALTAGGGVNAGGALILASFLYGIFHAAGPGHGKAILTTYLLTHRERVRKGVRLAAAAALCQGLTAVVLVYGLIGLAGWLPRETGVAVMWSERMSFLLVFAVGAMLSLRAVRGIVAEWRPQPAVALPSHDPAGGLPHDHGPDCGCGHVHAPSTGEIDRAVDLRTTLGLILSIGLRPCSGAVLVLVFAKVAGLAWAGVGAVVAMSIGTATAIAGLAFLAVHARHRVAGWTAGRHGGVRIAGAVVGLGGGILVMAIGVSLILASMAPRHPLGIS